MLKIEKYVTMSPEQWAITIEGMRNPMNSWDRMDSYKTHIEDPDTLETADFEFFVGDNDYDLMKRLAMGGPVHAKYRRMMPTWVMINAPLYWWKEFDTYKVGTVANSCSTMHKIHAKEFTMDDFSCERMTADGIETLRVVIDQLNRDRQAYLETKDMDYWHDMIQLLPTSFNQKRLVFINYETCVGIHEFRKNHKLPEWHVFCDWIEQLPLSEMITLDFPVLDDEE